MQPGAAVCSLVALLWSIGGPDRQGVDGQGPMASFKNEPLHS
jgi:hypothetical protein